MQKRVALSLCIGLALLSGCIPAGKTLEDYMPQAEVVWLPSAPPPALAPPTPVAPPASVALRAFEPFIPVDETLPPGPAGVVFEDPAFEAAVRTYLDKPTGAITPQDFEDIEGLAVTTQPPQEDMVSDAFCVVYEAVSIEDVALFSGIHTLILDKFNNFSLAPCADLDLSWLELWNCADFHDLELLSEPSRNCSILDFLGIYNCVQFDDLTPVKDFANLTSLECVNTRVSSLAPIGSMTHLTHLDMFGNRIRDLSPIAPLFHLQYLNVSNNYITDITPLSGMASLRTACIANNRIVDLKPLQALRLQNLYIDLNEITSIAPLASQTEMSTLDLSFNPVRSLSVLPRLTALSAINVEGLPPKLLSALLRMAKLEYVCIDADQAAMWRERLAAKSIDVKISDKPQDDSADNASPNLG